MREMPGELSAADWEDALAGSALGLFAGDALGAPVEGMPYGPLRELGWVAEMAGGRGEPGSYTDDTQLMIGMLEALAEDDALPEGLMARRYAENFEPRRGYGASTGATLAAIREGSLPPAALSRDSFGNGGAMGIAPLGVYFCRDWERMLSRAEAACRTTHTHPGAVGAALAVAGCAALLARARPGGERPTPGAVLKELLGIPAVSGSPVAEPLARLEALPVATPPEERVAFFAQTFACDLRAVESAPAAIGAALAAASFRDAVEVAVNSGGDTDTVGAMAGGIAGAWFGEQAIPPSWLAAMENGPKGRDYLRGLVGRLTQAQSSVGQ